MRVLSIACQTLVEQWRQRTAWGFGLVALLMALPALTPIETLRVDGHALHGAAAIARPIFHGMLGFAQFIALVLAIVLASGLIATDRERGTLLMLVTKPMARYQVLLGKALGGIAWMLGAWTLWGTIAGLALGIRFGWDMFGPVFVGFVASSLGSALAIAFTLLLSCLLPAGSAIGLAILAWLLTSAAPRMATMMAALGHQGAARTFAAIGWALPLGRLSGAASELADGRMPGLPVIGACATILLWWGIAALVFTREDLAPGAP